MQCTTEPIRNKLILLHEISPADNQWRIAIECLFALFVLMGLYSMRLSGRMCGADMGCLPVISSSAALWSLNSLCRLCLSAHPSEILYRTLGMLSGWWNSVWQWDAESDGSGSRSRSLAVCYSLRGSRSLSVSHLLSNSASHIGDIIFPLCLHLSVYFCLSISPRSDRGNF